MRWVNFTEAKPPEDANYAVRLLSRDMYFGTDDIIRYRKSKAPSDHGEVVEIRSTYENDPHTWPLRVLEWLDDRPLVTQEDLEALKERRGY